MELAPIIREYYSAFIEKYRSVLLPGHLKAIDAICRCRTPDSGQVYVKCPDCDHYEWRSVSCGNRNCPKCQNHEASQWIDRQLSKLLPVQYFMVTFTLPYELRYLAWKHQKTVYSAFFSCVSSTLNDFGLNPKHLGAHLGMTMVMHTHNRKLDFHPHIHVVIPAGGINKSRRQWIKKKGRYLFNQKALAKVFRARFLDFLNKSGFSLPQGITSQWVVDCTRVGSGTSALKYLSRYLYRGVIGECNIVANTNGHVTFKYAEGKTGKTRHRCIKGEDFLFLILQHVLPKGFRRTRDYGFLHGNAKRLLTLVQMVLHVKLKPVEPRERKAFQCPCCQRAMETIGFRPALPKPG